MKFKKKISLKKEKIINQTNSDEPFKLKLISHTHNSLNPRPELNQEA
jgi:hypothetical protein